ncbi:MAG: flagellar hook protein FlgE [Pacificimonas sp.]
MTLYSALFSGVSGLNAFSSAMGVISDNITNVNTVGYKAGDNQFATLVTDSRSAGRYAPGGVTNVVRSQVSQQGLLQQTGSGTDLSVDGAGFFVTETSGGETRFTRAGSFTPDAEGNLRNASGLYLTGTAIDRDGNSVDAGDVGQLSRINIAQLSGTAEATTEIRFRANLQSTQAAFTGAYAAGDLSGGTVAPHFERAVSVYDAQGGQHDVSIAFLKTGPNAWAAEVSAEGTLVASGMVRFNPDGSLDRAGSDTAIFDPFTPTWAGGAGSSPIMLALGTDGDVDGISQFDSESALLSRSVDGALFGNVTGVEISEDGTVSAIFDNGQSRAVYRVPLVTFQNPDGLLRLQGNSYGASDFSGDYALTGAGTGGSGRIVPGALEASTVDLAKEFTNMITVQRAYSASTRIITTADEMLQELTAISR